MPDLFTLFRTSRLAAVIFVACAPCLAAQATVLSKKHDPHFESDPLVELAATIECRAAPSSTHHLAEGLRHSLLHSGSSPRYAEWKRRPDADDSRIEIELPSEINVFGTRTRSITLTEGKFEAILDGITLDEVSRNAGFQRRQDTWKDVAIKPIAVRNAGNGSIKVRAMIARNDTRPGQLVAGCGEFVDTRQQERDRSRVDAPFKLGADSDVMKVVHDILTCRSNRHEEARLRSSLLMHSSSDTPSTPWKHQRGEQGSEWTLPTPLDIDGLTVSKLWLIDDSIAAVVEATSRKQLGRQWRLEENYNDSLDQLYLRTLDARIADDGWIEGRERFVLEWEKGTSVTGCNYEESYPDYGWWPEEDDE